MASSIPTEEECGSDASSGVLFPLIFQEQVNVEVTKIPLPKSTHPLYIKCLPNESVGIVTYENGYGISENVELYYSVVDKSGSVLTKIILDKIIGCSIHDVRQLCLSFDITDYGDIFHCCSCKDNVKDGLYRTKLNGNDRNTYEECEGKVDGVCFVPPNMLLCSIVLQSGGKVIKQDLFAKRTVQIIEKNEKGENMFMRPGNLRTNKNGDICVIDSDKLIVVDKLGTKRFEYTGTGYDDFKPTDVACDLQKRILIADQRLVHLLDENGVFIMFVVTQVHHGLNVDFRYNSSFDIDNQGRLWTIGNYCFLIIKYADSVNAALRNHSH